jgi:hypothetical protein
MIITSITGYRVEQVDPFFRTLRLYYDGPVVVLAGVIDTPMREYLKRQKVDIHYAGQLNVNRYHWNNFRFLFLNMLLDNSQIDLKHAPWTLHCDCRDVIFQANPVESRWLGFYPSAIHVALENNFIKSSRGNLKWMLRTMGLWKTFLMRNCRVSCAGTTIADPSSLRSYVDLMAEGILRRPFIGRWSGTDQALHNWLLWQNPFNLNIHYHPNWQGQFLTLDSEKLRNKDAQGRWINGDGTVIPIIHQWDRV